MKKKRRIEIITLTEQSLWLKGAALPVVAWCVGCAAEGMMVTPEVAAASAAVSTRAVYRWVEAGRVHFRETPEGSILVCLASLPAGGDDAPR